MNVTRRQVVGGAVALPALAALGHVGWREYRRITCVYDHGLPAGVELARAAERSGQRALAIEGDRIRFAREVLARRPAVLHGLSRQGDAVLIADVAREAGYRLEHERVQGAAIEWTLVRRS